MLRAIPVTASYSRVVLRLGRLLRVDQARLAIVRHIRSVRVVGVGIGVIVVAVIRRGGVRLVAIPAVPTPITPGVVLIVAVPTTVPPSPTIVVMVPIVLVAAPTMRWSPRRRVGFSDQR